MPEPPPKKKSAIYFLDKTLSDVTVVVGEQDFLVHRMFLAAQSDFFKILLYGDFKEAEESRIVIKEVSEEVFGNILNVLYFGKFYEYGDLIFRRTYCDDGEAKYLYHEGGDVLSQVENYLRNFWSFVHEILAVADRFDVTKRVTECLRDRFYLMICPRHGCLVCLNLYMCSLELKMTTVLKRFQDFTLDDYDEWHSAVFKKEAPMRPPLRQLEPQELRNVIAKFR